MHACTIDRSGKRAATTVVVVGHCGEGFPAGVEREAARLAKREGKGPTAVVEDGREFLLVEPEPKPWLTGGGAWRVLGKTVASHLREREVASATVAVEADPEDIQALVEGLILADYRYDECRSGESGKRKRIAIHIPGGGAAVTRGRRVAVAQNHARTLVDAPGNRLTPPACVDRIRKLLRGTGLRTKVTAGLAELKRAGFPGLVQVGGGGSAPPALLEIRYRPGGGGTDAARRRRHLALVGKGITFDSGGISLKPSSDMWRMKGDLGGAAAVCGAMSAIARAKPKLPVTAYLALAENLPGRKAQRPGDIYRARNGTWVHVDNTDAEGRLVLADVLTYAGERGATHVVDLATLTGACLVALGPHIAAVMGNDEDWVEAVRAAGRRVGEDFWPLPLYGGYEELLKHPHADVSNAGGKYGGTITAGLFLQRFVGEGVSWAHLDIAGPALLSDSWLCYGKGGTGFGVRSLIALVEGL